MAANGITYKYPDPTSQYVDGLSPQGANFQSTNSLPRDVPLTGAGQKRKRKSHYHLIQSDAAPSPKNDANAQFQQVQTQRILAEAKRKGRYISAEAAISGKQLLVKLPIGSLPLARINGSAAVSESPEQMDLGGDAVNDRRDTTLLESDLPTKPFSDAQKVMSKVFPKKRRVRVETDEDFSNSRSGNRRSSAAQNCNGRKSTLTHIDVSDESEVEEGHESLPQETQAHQRKSKERPLPSYLARRSPAADENSTKELPKKPRGRPPTKKQSGDRPVSPFTGDSTVNGVNLLPDLVSSLRTDVDMVIDDPEAEALSNSLADTRPSTLKPGASRSTPSNPIGANRKAKMKAMKWAESGGPTGDSESDSGSMIELAIPKNTKAEFRSLDRHTSSSKEGRMAKKLPAIVIPMVTKRSIFSKPGAKIRVTSVKAAGGNTASGRRNGGFHTQSNQKH
ncbi:MAG: hypothetical protein Q9187_004356 [Circinaria calcarea]